MICNFKQTTLKIHTYKGEILDLNSDFQFNNINIIT